MRIFGYTFAQIVKAVFTAAGFIVAFLTAVTPFVPTSRRSPRRTRHEPQRLRSRQADRGGCRVQGAAGLPAHRDQRAGSGVRSSTLCA